MTKRALQTTRPCYLHRFHSPLTVVNEEHHPHPQEWQKALWGKVKDNRTVSLCATGHNTVHYCIDYFEKNGKYPLWCRGATRALVQRAFILQALAEASTAT